MTSMESSSIVVQEWLAVDERPKQVLGGRRAPTRAGAEVLQPVLDLRPGRRTAERSQVQFLDQIAICLATQNRFGHAATTAGDGIGNGLAVHQIQRLRKADVAAPLALARRFARWPSEQVQETILTDVRIGQLLSARVGW